MGVVHDRVWGRERQLGGLSDLGVMRGGEQQARCVAATETASACTGKRNPRHKEVPVSVLPAGTQSRSLRRPGPQSSESSAAPWAWTSRAATLRQAAQGLEGERGEGEGSQGFPAPE